MDYGSLDNSAKKLKIINSHRLLIIALGVLIILLAIFFWNTKKRLVYSEKVSSNRYGNLAEPTVAKQFSTPQTLYEESTISRLDLMKFSSLEDLKSREEKIPWNWAADVKLADQAMYAATKALDGDNRWARQMAIMAHPPYSNQLEMANRGEFGVPFPPGISKNRLDWYKLAAERGDAESQLAYWNGVDAIPTYADIQKIPQSELERYQANARQYLQSAINNGLADAYNYASVAYRDGKMGLQQSVVKAHACLIVLVNKYPTPETRQLLGYSASRLRSGELAQAIEIASDPLNCSVI
jgi:TPR repeat protein